LFDVLDFSNGFAGFDLAGIAPGAAASVIETFPTGFTADTYYVFGPTADNATPHWYEFMYDGTTGDEIIGNQVVLHYREISLCPLGDCSMHRPRYLLLVLYLLGNCCMRYSTFCTPVFMLLCCENQKFSRAGSTNR
jgi:hypothetical protein